MVNGRKSEQISKTESGGFKRLKSITICCLLIILAFIVMLIVAANLSVKPLEKKIREYLDSINVSAGSVNVSLSSGVVITNVKCWPEEKEGEPVWYGKSLTLKIHLLPLIRGKVVPKKIILDGFVFQFEQKSDGEFILPQLLFAPQNAQGGMVRLSSLLFTVKNSQVRYKEQANRFENPIDVQFDNINCDGKYYDSGRINLSNLKGEYAGAPINLNGEFSISVPYSASLHIKAEQLDLSNFANSLARLFPSDQSLLPSGGGSFDLKLTGTLPKPEIKGTCHLNKIKLGDVHINDVNFEVNYSDKQLSFKDGVAKAYNGRINISGTIDARDIIPTFTIDAEVKGFDIGKYLDSLGKNIDPVVIGPFDGSFHGGGNFYSKDAFHGEGTLKCSGGTYLNPFQNAKLNMFSQRQEQYMGFIHLDIDYGIENEKFDFKQINMQSKWIELTASGEFSFDWDANIKGKITASTELIKATSGFKEVIEFLGRKKDKIPVNFLMTGTYPDYTFHTALPEEVIDEFLGDDQERRERARELWRRYFGEGNEGISDTVINTIPDID